MKKQLQLLFFALMLACTSTYGQEIFLIQDYMEVDPNISVDDKEKIIASCTRLVNEYAEIASFWDNAANQFSEKKYVEYGDLFSGTAKVYNDLVKKPTNIEYGFYADNVFQHLQEEGVKFDVNDVFLNNIRYDSSGFYIATLDVEKILYNGLDDDNVLVGYTNGRKFNLKMQIDMPDYDLTEAKIIRLEGEVEAVSIESSSQLSIDLSYGIGFVEKTAGTQIADIEGSFESYGTSSIGLDVLYRRSIAMKRKLHILAGIKAQYIITSTDVASFSDLISEDEDIFLGGAAVSAMGTPQPGIESFEKTLRSLNDGAEIMNIITVEIPLGLSYKFLDKYNYDAFIDVSVHPLFVVSGTGNLSGTANFVRLPEDRTNFPEITVAELETFLLENSKTDYDVYFPTDAYDEDVVLEETPNFSLALQIAPVFQYDLNFNYGIEVGLNYWMNILPLIQGSQDPFNYTDAINTSASTSPSILERYFESVSTSFVSLKLGFFYRFN